ncbi:MAG: hypothetical protein AAGH43_00940 [Pseudomonadota bacterium]
MAEDSTTGLPAGDRAQGYEVTGPGSVDGLDAAFGGKDTRDRDAAVTLLLLSEDQDQSALFDVARSYEQLDVGGFIAPRTIVRFGIGSAAVVGKEQGAPLSGVTLSVWLGRRTPVDAPLVARLLLPVLKALSVLHGRGMIHGMVSPGHIIVDPSGETRLLAPMRLEGGQAAEDLDASLAPELAGAASAQRQAGPVSDIFSVAALLFWALYGDKPPSAKDRLAATAQRDEDPLPDVRSLLDAQDADLVGLIETGLRLHPATRPQTLERLIEVLERLAEDAKQETTSSAENVPPPLPWSQKKTADIGEAPPEAKDATAAAGATPPPLPPRPRGVPPIPKRQTSTIGEAPPKQSGDKRKRRIGIGTILSFTIALGVAWMVASGDMFGSEDSGSTETIPSTRQTEPQPVDSPRKGPQSTNQVEQETAAPANQPADGVLQQFCSSRFTFEARRDAGTNALRNYLSRCEAIDGPFVDEARDLLGIQN